MADITLTVPGVPRPSGRPRFARIGNGVRTFPDPKDGPPRQAIEAEWIRAGCPRLHGPWTADIEVVVPRPKSHWCQSGLSAAGRRSVAPPGDVDNFAKLPLDTLVKVSAVPDDRYCLALRIVKRWGDRGSDGELLVTLTSADA